MSKEIEREQEVITTGVEGIIPTEIKEEGVIEEGTPDVTPTETKGVVEMKGVIEEGTPDVTPTETKGVVGGVEIAEVPDEIPTEVGERRLKEIKIFTRVLGCILILWGVLYYSWILKYKEGEEVRETEEVREISDGILALEASEIAGVMATTPEGEVLVIYKDQVADRLTRDLRAVRNALDISEEEFQSRMGKVSDFEGQEGSELEFFKVDSLGALQLEVYLDYLVGVYDIQPTQEKLDEMLDFYMKAFEELKADGEDVDDMFNMEFGMGLQEWLDVEKDAMVARSMLVEGYPTRGNLLQEEAERLYKEMGDFARVYHILVDDLVEAERLLGIVNSGVHPSELHVEYSNDPSGPFYEFLRGDMMEEFENWAFEAVKGDTGVVETPFGFHVMLSQGITEGISDTHTLIAQRYLAEESIFESYLNLEWTEIDE
jgi:hypothetical protein